MTAAPVLSGRCPLCSQPSPRSGLACDACAVAARDYITRAGTGRPLTLREVAVVLAQPGPAPDDVLPLPARPAAEPAVEWRRNQRCWTCDTRATCRPDPAMPPDHWICRHCWELPV